MPYAARQSSLAPLALSHRLTEMPVSECGTHTWVLSYCLGVHVTSRLCIVLVSLGHSTMQELHFPSVRPACDGPRMHMDV